MMLLASTLTFGLACCATAATAIYTSWRKSTTTRSCPRFPKGGAGDENGGGLREGIAVGMEAMVTMDILLRARHPSLENVSDRNGLIAKPNPLHRSARSPVGLDHSSCIWEFHF